MLAALLLVATAVRTTRQYHPGGAYDRMHGGMADYHNGAYYPALALRQGISPYGDEFARTFPVARATPAYSPAIIALHIPLTFIPLPWSDVVYFLFLVAVLAACLAITWREATDGLHPVPWNAPALAWLAAALLASRAGHTTLLNGYFTPLIVLGTLLSLQQAHLRPWLAGVGFALAATKPNYAFPLAIVMAARGNYRALFAGIFVSAIAAMLPTLWLVWHSSWSGFMETIRQGQNSHMEDLRELPVHTWTRIDMTAILAKWTGANPNELWQLLAMLGWLVLPCLALHRLRKAGDHQGSTSLSGLIAALAVLVSFYHQVYDGLILVAGIVAMVCRPLPIAIWTMPKRLILGLLIGCCWWNYAGSEIAMGILKPSPFQVQLLTSLNALMLFIALGWTCILAMRSSIPRTNAKPSLPQKDALV